MKKDNLRKKIIDVLQNAINVLKNNTNMIGTKQFPTNVTARDIYQRMDEVCLIYSDIFDISFNKVQKELDCKEYMDKLFAEQSTGEKGK